MIYNFLVETGIVKGITQTIKNQLSGYRNNFEIYSKHTGRGME